MTTFTAERPTRTSGRVVILDPSFDSETEMVWGTPYIDPVELDEAWQSVQLARLVSRFEELEGFSHRRYNPRARSMRHCGCRDKAHKASHGTYEIRKDHGTTAHYREIDAANVSRHSRTKGSKAQQRKLAKLEAHKGSERVVAKLIRLGVLMVDED